MVAAIGTALLSAGASAAVGMVTSKLAGGASSKGFSQAGGALAAGAAEATGALQNFYGQTKDTLSPYKRAGDAGLSMLEQMYGLSRTEAKGPTEGEYWVKESLGDRQTSGNTYQTGTGPFPNAEPGGYTPDGGNIGEGPSAIEGGGYTLEATKGPDGTFSSELTTPDVFDASSIDHLKPGVFDASGIDNLAPRNMSSEDILQKDPGYQFRLDEGAKAMGSAANAAGYSNSGRFAKEMERYGQGFASNEFGAAYGRREAEYGRAYGSLADTYRSKGDVYGRARDNLTDTYNTRVADRQNRYNKLLTLTGMGERADYAQVQAGATTAVGIANAYTGLAQGQSNLAMGQGGAQAGFINQAGGAVNSAIQGGFKNYAAGQARDQNQINYDNYLNTIGSQNSITGVGRSLPGQMFNYNPR